MRGLLTDRLAHAVRLLLGACYLINGTNWFFKIITPYPSISDFIHYQPPPDIVGALINNGILFHLAKATELIAGVALLGNRFVPLMLVVAMTVTVPVFLVDDFTHPHLRGVLMGTGSLVMNVFLLLAYFHHYRPMLAARAQPHLDPTQAPRPGEGATAAALAAVLRPVLPVLGVVAAALGCAMLAWLLVMVGQYVVDPQPITAVHALKPR